MLGKRVLILSFAHFSQSVLETQQSMSVHFLKFKLDDNIHFLKVKNESSYDRWQSTIIYYIRNCILTLTPFITAVWNSTLYSVYLLFSPAITGILGNLCGYYNSKVTEILLNKACHMTSNGIILDRNVYAKSFLYDLFAQDYDEKVDTFGLFNMF